MKELSKVQLVSIVGGGQLSSLIGLLNFLLDFKGWTK